MDDDIAVRVIAAIVPYFPSRFLSISKRTTINEPINAGTSLKEISARAGFSIWNREDFKPKIVRGI